MGNSFLSQIAGASNTERILRAYAYLQVSFSTSSRSERRIDDILDCLLPFIIGGISEQHGNQLDIKKLQQFLNDNFDFSIPVYVINHLLPRAQEKGVVKWNNVLRVYICQDADNDGSSELLSPDVISTDDFAGVESAIRNLAASFNLSEPISSSNWSEALIRFLKSGSELPPVRTAEIRGIAISEADDVDNFVVARFIQHSQNNNPSIFSIITKIYTGILIEDFVRTIQEIGVEDEYSRLTVYYDTSILLRLLGSSGIAHQKANLEMHHAIQNLGCKTQYFEHTEIEVENILQTILSNYDSGNQLFGETAEAMFSGELRIETIKDLSATFIERIAQLNIFKSRFAYENTTTANYHQIDETEFKEFLSSEAEKTRRKYSNSNLVNDTKTLALTMRLRHGVRSRDVAKCKHVFVSSNKLFVRSSRAFIATNENFGWRNAPPLLTVGQMSTLAWLAGSQELESREISTELLANCYGAVQPDQDWTPEFLKELEKFKEGTEDVSIAESAVFLNAARRIAQDQSFAKTAIFQQLNALEIFGLAKKESLAEQENLRKDAIRASQAALIEGLSKGRAAERKEQKDSDRRRAERWSERVVRYIQFVIILLAVFALLSSEGLFGSGSILIITGQLIIFILALLQIADVVGISVARSFLDRFRVQLADRFVSFLAGR